MLVAVADGPRRGLRFATLDRQSFWLDELVTVSLLRLDFDDLLRTIPESEATPYLYYVLAWPWTRLFGFDEVGLRSLSALAGAAIVPVAYGAGAVLVSRRTGLVAAALVSVHPFLVWYSQEARAYGLFALLAAVSVLFFGQALRAGGRWAFVGWAVASSLALATHYFAVFLIVPEAVWLLLRSPARRPALLATVLPSVVLLVHLPLALDQRGAGEAVTEASLVSRVAGIPKGLTVGYSFPAEIVGSVLAGALLVVGLVLLLVRTPPELRRRALVPGGLGGAVDSRARRARSRRRRLRDRPEHDPCDRAGRHLRRRRLRGQPARPRCGCRARSAPPRHHALRVSRPAVRPHRLAWGGGAPRLDSCESGRSWSRRT